MDTLRLDKWLWAARFYKTRSLATAAINGGHVHLNSERIKPSKTIKLDDAVRIRKGSMEMTVVVKGISDKRGPAPVAQTLYEETAESLQAREQARAQVRAQSAVLMSDHKPNKQERRELLKFKQNQGD